MKLPFPQGEDIALNLEITDMIRSKAVLPKPAMQSLKKRVGSPNGRVQMYALSVSHISYAVLTSSSLIPVSRMEVITF